MIMSVVLFIHLSLQKHISRTMHPNVTTFCEHVASGRGSIPLSRRCSALCTSGFVDDVVISYSGPNGGILLPQQRRARVPALAASYWWRRGRQRASRLADQCNGCPGQSLQYTIALLVWR